MVETRRTCGAGVGGGGVKNMNNTIMCFEDGDDDDHEGMRRKK